MVDLNVLGPPLKVLAKYIKKGLEATVDPWLWNWRARKKGEAELTATESEIDAFNALVEAQAGAANAFLNKISSTAETIEWKSEIENNLEASQVQKRINNQVSIVRGAASDLENIEVEDHEPDPDWTARFFESAQDVSAEELQAWWSKILAGEIQDPGQTSLRTMSTLRDLSPQDASEFEKLADCVIGGDSIFFSVSSDSMNFNFFLKYFDIMRMQECGLINWSIASGKLLVLDANLEIILPHHSSFLLVKKEANKQNQLSIPVAHLTTAGQELYKITKPKLQAQYLEDLSTYLHHQKVQLFLLEGPQKLPNGNITYASKVPIEPRPILPGMPVT